MSQKQQICNICEKSFISRLPDSDHGDIGITCDECFMRYARTGNKNPPKYDYWEFEGRARNELGRSNGMTISVRFGATMRPTKMKVKGYDRDGKIIHPDLYKIYSIMCGRKEQIIGIKNGVDGGYFQEGGIMERVDFDLVQSGMYLNVYVRPVPAGGLFFVQGVGVGSR